MKIIPMDLNHFIFIIFMITITVWVWLKSLNTCPKSFLNEYNIFKKKYNKLKLNQNFDK